MPHGSMPITSKLSLTANINAGEPCAAPITIEFAVVLGAPGLKRKFLIRFLRSWAGSLVKFRVMYGPFGWA